MFWGANSVRIALWAAVFVPKSDVAPSVSVSFALFEAV